MVGDFPRGNSVSIDWYVRMPTDPCPDGSKDVMQPELCEEAGATWEPTDPESDSWPPH